MSIQDDFRVIQEARRAALILADFQNKDNKDLLKLKEEAEALSKEAKVLRESVAKKLEDLKKKNTEIEIFKDKFLPEGLRREVVLAKEVEARKARFATSPKPCGNCK